VIIAILELDTSRDYCNTCTGYITWLLQYVYWAHHVIIARLVLDTSRDYYNTKSVVID